MNSWNQMVIRIVVTAFETNRKIDKVDRHFINVYLQITY